MSGDKEKEKDNGDYLGYGVYADTLWNRIQAALDKDLGSGKELGDDPLVVGIFGEWGAGKSTLLKLTLDRASDYEAQRARNRSGEEGGFGDAGFGLTVPVLFQPWKYEHEPHLLIPLLLHIIQALRDSIPKAQTLSEKSAQAVDGVWSASIGALPALVENFETVYKATVADLAVADPVTAAGVSVGFKTAGWLAKLLKRPDDADWLRDFKFSSEGRFYYNFHNVLCALTRPGKRVEALGKLKLSPSARINFVIFIDDLDRCLPEKAVETLELIKTVFNVESFAFVLALDEEVVERGIGYRYKDYALQNKKPEMPITGFEYLEKIVHLPFRLPGLTREQASSFLQRYEKDQVAIAKPERWWFARRPAEQDEKNKLSREAQQRQPRHEGQEAVVDLTSLVLSAFTAYVPRKLVRLVELLHQVQDVALQRGRILTAGGAQGTDVRVVTALLMLQLFQPDLYRLVRRKQLAFPLFLAAFATRTGGYREFDEVEVSDVDLWLWVVDESAGDSDDWIQSSELRKVMDAVVLQIAKKHHVFKDNRFPGGISHQEIGSDGKMRSVVETDTAKTRAQRSRAQNVKLPLIAQIVEHRSTHRHAFDPLRLFHALAGALEQGWESKRSDAVSPAADVRISDYFELMVSAGSAPEPNRRFVTATFSGAWSVEAQINAQPVRYPDRLFADITSDQPEVQANLVANNELEGGKYLELEAAQHLLAQLKSWQGSLENQDRSEGKLRLTRGLNIIAPLVPRELGREFLSLVDDPESIPFHVPGRPLAFSSDEEVQRAADRADLWSALGVDDRFDAKRFQLPKLQRRLPVFSSTENEPIPGFVRVFADEEQPFRLFAGPAIKLRTFYMARYLTTVDQYACFLEAGGYGQASEKKPAWWDSLGWLWRTGQWNSEVKEQWLRDHIARRPSTSRDAPVGWKEQRANGSRPVMQLNWFEARAYARWLSLKLSDEREAKLPAGYEVRLPTGAQWERAARAKNLNEADERLYPWDSAEKETAYLHANIQTSHIGQPSPVGLFAPNPLGLYDLSGNLWEWQNNRYLADGSGQDQDLPADVTLKTHEELFEPGTPTLRGGAWYVAAEYADSSIRARNLPDHWFNNVGFRVVLSLAEQPPETKQ